MPDDNSTNPDWLYVYTERLAILCGNLPPTPAHQALARKDADEYLHRLNQPSHAQNDLPLSSTKPTNDKHTE